MKTLITKLIGAAFILGATHSHANTPHFSIINLPESSTLTMRAWPSPISRPIASIAASTSKIEGTGRTIFKESLNWTQIHFGDQKGWVESRFLTQFTEKAPEAAAEPEIRPVASAPNPVVLPPTPPTTASRTPNPDSGDTPTAQTDNKEAASVVGNTNTQTTSTNNNTTADAEVFSYGSTPTEAVSTPKNTILTTDNPNEIIITNIRYPWSAEADTIYHDPRPSAPKPVVRTMKEFMDEQNNATAPVEPQPTAVDDKVTRKDSVEMPSVQSPIITTQSDASIFDYEDSDMIINRYETIEASSITSFIN